MSDARRRGGTYGVYDRMGDFVGTVCVDAGRALIGGETYLRDTPDREALLALAEEIHGLVENQEIRFFHVVQVHESTLATIEARIREACGEVVE